MKRSFVLKARRPDPPTGGTSETCSEFCPVQTQSRKPTLLDHVNGMPTWNDHGSSLALGRLLAWRGVFAHEMLMIP